MALTMQPFKLPQTALLQFYFVVDQKFYDAFTTYAPLAVFHAHGA